MDAEPPYALISDMIHVVEEAPVDSIVSRTVYRDPLMKAILFAFAPGQELSEHTASVPAIIQILEGACQVTLGHDLHEAKAGFWARMPAGLPHSLVALTPVKMLLLMLPGGKEMG